MDTTTERIDSHNLLELYRRAWDLPADFKGRRDMDQTVSRCFQELIHAWTAPSRHYHSLTEHLQPMISSIRIRCHLRDRSWVSRTLVMAAFYHGAKMDFGLPDADNVRDSAAYWAMHHSRVCGDDCNTGFRNDVSALIMATDYSVRVEDLPPDSSMIRNYDLIGLGGSWGTYSRNTLLLWEEAQQTVRDAGREWKASDTIIALEKRISWLRGMLRLPQIFVETESEWEDEESQARINLGRDLVECMDSLDKAKSRVL